MRHLLFLFLLVVSQTVMGNDYVTVFKASSSVCTPITIKSSAGNYTLTSELRIPKSLSWFEAFDCQGRKLMNPGGSVSVGTGQTTIRTYVFTTLFPSSQNQNVESANSNTTQSSYGEYNSDYTKDLADKLTDYSTSKGWDIDYNSITIDAGYGFPYGGLGLRTRYISSSVIGVSAALGYNTKYDENTNNNKQLYWNAGLQFHLNKFIALGFYGGPQYFKEFDKTDISFGAFVEYSHKFTDIIGITGGLGCVIDGEQKDTKGFFAGHIGLTFEIFADD